jgi:uncharacterized Fe-S center protein
MSYPKMVRIRQRLADDCIENIQSAIKSEMHRLNISTRIEVGSSVTITAGSRGIADIVEITASIVKEVKKLKANPFIVPAMGSHGEATADGQLAILEEYGITRKSIGEPILSSMEVVQIGETRSGVPVFIDKKAHEADHIIVINRIKPHTEFHGAIESSLMKMMVIDLGKHKGTIVAYRFAVKLGYERTIIETGSTYWKKHQFA